MTDNTQSQLSSCKDGFLPVDHEATRGLDFQELRSLSVPSIVEDRNESRSEGIARGFRPGSGGTYLDEMPQLDIGSGGQGGSGEIGE